jgi:hypothetical protein
MPPPPPSFFAQLPTPVAPPPGLDVPAVAHTMQVPVVLQWPVPQPAAYAAPMQRAPEPAKTEPEDESDDEGAGQIEAERDPFASDSEAADGKDSDAGAAGKAPDAAAAKEKEKEVVKEKPLNFFQKQQLEKERKKKLQADESLFLTRVDKAQKNDRDVTAFDLSQTKLLNSEHWNTLGRALAKNTFVTTINLAGMCCCLAASRSHSTSLMCLPLLSACSLAFARSLSPCTALQAMRCIWRR